MTRAHAAADLNIKNAAEKMNNKKYNYISGVDKMLEFDEYRLSLEGMEKDITDLRDAL